MSIFDKRTAFKPFEYPEFTGFKDAINNSFWLVSEWTFVSDVNDFKTKLSQKEKETLKRAILAISQIEVSVKRFWADLGKRFPKPEIEQVGITFGESEVRHADAYSHLLEVLGFNKEFDQVLQIPEIQGRVDYLTKYLRGAADNSNQNYTLTLTLFSIFIENVSLFSQFLIIKSFNKYLNTLKDIDNVVQATQQEETVHALFGVALIQQIKKEFPDWFNEEFYSKLYRACNKAFKAEDKIIDWIMPEDLDFLSRKSVKEFIKDRFNYSLELIGGQKVFEVDNEELSKTAWFYEELNGQVNMDFFAKRPTSYNKFAQPVTEESLFDD